MGDLWRRLGRASPRRAGANPGQTRGGRGGARAHDDHLATRRWLVGDHITIADIALYAYTHVADAGGFDLAPHANLSRWLEEIAAIPGHVPIEA